MIPLTGCASMDNVLTHQIFCK